MISGQNLKSVGAFVRTIALTVLTTSFFVGSANAQIPFGGFNRNGVVGGVSVDASGAVRDASVQQRQQMLQEMRKSIKGSKLATAGLRVVSLKGLQAEIESAIQQRRPVSEEALFLAGLQRIEYVFADPETQDILLAGPAEAWKVRDDAAVVGVKSGRPVIQLVDLLTAFGTVDAARQAPISVSIEPTAEGQQRLAQLLSRVRTGAGFNPAQLEPAMKQAFGPQQVKLTTVATDSRMAQTLLAADYQMKRLAMDLDRSPVSGLPSYMSMAKNARQTASQSPRWWIACEYDAIEHTADRLAWHLDGLGIRAMTEDEHVDAAGNRSGTGKTSRIAQQWADNFTDKYSQLCSHNAALGDLRNLMDLNVIATIISAHQLESVAGCDLSGLRNQEQLPSYHTPKTLGPQCSFVKGNQGWVVSASGGVDINPWKVVATSARQSDTIASVRGKAVANRQQGQWWWD